LSGEKPHQRPQDDPDDRTRPQAQGVWSVGGGDELGDREAADARLSIVSHRAGAGIVRGAMSCPVCRARPRALPGSEGDARQRGVAVRPGGSAGRGRSHGAQSSLDRPHVRPFPAASPVVVGASPLCVDDPTTS